MVNVEQCRGARALLGWSAEKLAEEAGIGVATVRRYEGGNAVASASIEVIAAALAGAGIVFIGDGESSAAGGVGLRLGKPAGPEER